MGTGQWTLQTKHNEVNMEDMWLVPFCNTAAGGHKKLRGDACPRGKWDRLSISQC